MNHWLTLLLNQLRHWRRHYGYDLPCAYWHLYWRGRVLNQPHAWLAIKNLGEKLTANASHTALRGEFPLGSYLHIGDTLPTLAHQLMQQALSHHPINLQATTANTQPPTISVIIPFKGAARLAQLHSTLQSWLAQTVTVECLVVEHSDEILTAEHLPTTVKHLHLPHPTRPGEWNKCWAMNTGARLAQGDILVFHDADILCPNNYAQALLDTFAKGAEAAALHRMLFYLNQADSEATTTTHMLQHAHPPTGILHSFEGGTIAIKRNAFFQIGGFDERFIGWGGEDNEFFDRCKMLNFERFGFLPFVHLWHPIQRGRADNRLSQRILETRLSIPRSQRAAELNQRHSGQTSKPHSQPYSIACTP